ncbi:hypothetical protein ABPG73_008977, partial [Tetrahymena malaccensis]
MSQNKINSEYLENSLDLTNRTTLSLTINFDEEDYLHKISSILDKNPNLVDLLLLLDNPNDQQFSEVGSILTKCKNLTSLSVDILTTDDAIESGAYGFSSALANCPNLKNFEFIICEESSIFSDEGASGLCSGLSECPNLTSVKLKFTGEYTCFYDEGVIGIGLGLGKCPNLTNLSLIIYPNGGGNFTEQGAAGLGQGLANCKNLKTLSLDIS